MLIHEFSISQPYFEGHEVEVLQFMNSIVPEGTNNQLRVLLKFLVASMLYHRTFLLNTLHPQSICQSMSFLVLTLLSDRL